MSGPLGQSLESVIDGAVGAVDGGSGGLGDMAGLAKPLDASTFGNDRGDDASELMSLMEGKDPAAIGEKAEEATLEEGASTEDEFVEAIDKDGNAKQIKVDYSDKKKIKAAYERAANATKLYNRYSHFKERAEAAEASLAAQKESSSKEASEWAELGKIMEEEGIEGIIEALHPLS